ncbi:MAG: peptidase U32 family protein [Anaeroplasmataceae bacterium]
MKKVELLAPAGDLEKLKIAILYGADAVFIGGTNFSLRSRASNFEYPQIKEACEFAHSHNAKVHVTCNILMHEIDLDGLQEHLQSLQRCGVDAIICASVYILESVKKYTSMEAHISTQQSIMNNKAVDFYKENNADRVVLSRELSVEEIKDIKDNTDLEVEVFIHGGMCVSYSGRCVLSNNMTNRDANRGGCAHSCRWNYDLYSNDSKVNLDGYFAMSSKDLCAVEYIKDLLDAKVDSFKIEGRMKSIHYIATVVKTYRKMIDEYYETGSISDPELYKLEIKKAENRLISTGFLSGDLSINEQLYDKRSEIPSQTFVGLVVDYCEDTKMCYLESRNFFSINDRFEIFGPNLDTTSIEITNLFDEDNNSITESRHPKKIVSFKSDIKLEKYDMLRIVK